jgi:hypothetical protein
VGAAPCAATPLKVRLRRETLTVVERSWADESDILRALQRTALAANTPRFYAGYHDIAVHEFLVGCPLAELCPPDKPLDPHHLDSGIAQFALLTEVSAADLPPLPAGWASDGDTRGFLRARVDFAEREVRRPNWAEFGGLFTALDVPADVLRRWRDRVPRLRRRPFALRHGDLHRQSIIVRDDGELALVDWELAMWGDPLHDLAIHLVRMRYPADQRRTVVKRRQAAVRPEVAAGLEQDLPVYLDHERAQSLFADTLRAALSLVADPRPGAVGAAIGQVRDAMYLAAGPLRLNRVPSLSEIERALLGWARGRGALKH